MQRKDVRDKSLSPLFQLIDSMERALLTIITAQENAPNPTLWPLIEYVIKQIDPVISKPSKSTLPRIKHSERENALLKLGLSHPLYRLNNNWSCLTIFLDKNNEDAFLQVKRLNASNLLFAMRLLTPRLLKLLLQVKLSRVNRVFATLELLLKESKHEETPLKLTESLVAIILANPALAPILARVMLTLHRHDLINESNLDLIAKYPAKLKYLDHFDIFDAEMSQEDRKNLMQGIIHGFANPFAVSIPAPERTRDLQDKVITSIQTEDLKQTLALSKRVDALYEEKTSSSLQNFEALVKTDSPTVALTKYTLSELIDIALRLNNLSSTSDAKKKEFLTLKKDIMLCTPLQKLFGQERALFFRDLDKRGKLNPLISALSFFVNTDSLSFLEKAFDFFPNYHPCIGNKQFKNPFTLDHLTFLIPFIERENEDLLLPAAQAFSWILSLSIATPQKMQALQENVAGIPLLTCIRFNSDLFSDQAELSMVAEYIYAGILPLMKAKQAVIQQPSSCRELPSLVSQFSGLWHAPIAKEEADKKKLELRLPRIQSF